MTDCILVTSYKNPDLDGTACVYAYSEFLDKLGKRAVPGIFGCVHQEAQFVMDRFGIMHLADAASLIDGCSGVIIVDASDMAGLDASVKPERVVEIIDHRMINQAALFRNATVQIELVGAAATLIAERFHTSNIVASRESSVLLYSAIVSNTVNFRANVTTKRDVAMAGWLKGKLKLPPGYIHDMFAAKSNIVTSVREAMNGELATFSMGGHAVGIAQLEIVDAEAFVRGHLDEIMKALAEIRAEKSLEFTFLTCIDVEKGCNLLVPNDVSTRDVLKKTLHVEFREGVALREGIIMRKEIVPLLAKLFGDR